MNIFEVLIVQPVFNMLMALYATIPGGDFGVAVIVFTVIIRFALYPLTKRMLHQSKMMRKLQPELVKIKKKAKGNRQLEAMQMMELYKKHGVSPFRSIGILLIQLPIFISLYYVIRIFTDNRGDIPKFTYDALERLGPVKQLVQNPTAFNENLFGVVDLTQSAISENGVSIALVLLALIAGYTQYIMSKQTMPAGDSKRGLRQIMAEAAEGKQADQSEMNAVVMRKMVKVLPIFMVFITISLPGALALYFAVSNSVAVLQQGYLLKQDEEELEELAEGPKTQSPSKAANASQKTQLKNTQAKVRNQQNTKKPKNTSSSTSPKSSETVVRVIAKDSGKRRKS